MKGFSFKGLVDLAQEAWNLATASVKKSGDTMTGDLILKPGTATPLTLGRGSQVSLRYEYAADAYKYLGVSTDGTIRYSNTPDLALDGQKIYHQGFKPTAADVGAVAKTGDTMTGELNMNGNKIFMDNANIDGLNCLTFSDAATNQSEGIRWPTTDGSTTYDGIHAAGGSLYFNGTNKVYHQGFKPTPADIGAAAASHTHTAADVGASPAGHTHTAADVGAVSKSGDTMSGTLAINRDHTHIGFGSASGVRKWHIEAKTDGTFAIVESDVGTRVSISPGGAITTGVLTAPKVLLSSAQGSEPNAVARKDYVDNITTIDVKDQRPESTPHAPYSLDKGIWPQFYNAGDLGVAGTYASTIEIQPWTDSSGGYCYQLIFGDNGQFAFRNGITTWGTTYKIYHQGFKPTAADGNSNIVAGAHDVVGAYGFLKLAVENGQDVRVGETYPGSSLGYASGAGSGYSGVPSGTWKCMGYIHTSADDSHDDVTLWVRVA